MSDRFFSGLFSSTSRDLDHLLRIPFDYQPKTEDECVVYCLWMVIHYYKNKHPNKQLREETRSISPDEILEELSIVEGGWRPNQDELSMVSERTKTLSFDLDFWQGVPPKTLHKIATENISVGQPVIPFIDGLQLRDGVRDNDGIHAVVAVGYNDDVLAIHDPWGYPEDTVEIDKIEDAWDPMFNQIITVNFSNKGKKIIGAEQ